MNSIKKFQGIQRPRAQFVANNTDASGSSTIREDGAMAREDGSNHQQQLLQYSNLIGLGASGALGGNNGGLRGGRAPTVFGPVNSLASATRLINHHLFGSTASSKQHTGK